MQANASIETCVRGSCRQIGLRTSGQRRPLRSQRRRPGSFKEESKSSAVPAELLRKSESHTQSPSKSAYA